MVLIVHDDHEEFHDDSSVDGGDDIEEDECEHEDEGEDCFDSDDGGDHQQDDGYDEDDGSITLQ